MPRSLVAPLIAAAALALAHGSAWALQVTMAVRVEEEPKPFVVGTTNLPDGFALNVTVRRRESAYMAQGQAIVARGAFRVGPFSQKGAPLNPGTYALEITSPGTDLQPPAVRNAIGRDGASLEGPLLKTSWFGGKAIAYQTTFEVGGGRISEERDRAAREQEERDRRSW